MILSSRNLSGGMGDAYYMPLDVLLKIDSRRVREVLELFYESHIYLALPLLHLNPHRHLLLP